MDAIIEQTLWDYFWLPKNTVVVDRPDILYWSHPNAHGYLNMVVRTRADPEQLDALVAEVADAHRSVPSHWVITPGCRSDALEEALRRFGYRPTERHVASVIEASAYTPHPSPGVTTRAVADLEQLRDWLRVREQAFGHSVDLGADHLRRELENCTGENPRVHRVVAYDSATQRPLSAGGLTLHPNLGFGFLWAGGTVPDGRGRGAYSAVVAARVEHARQKTLSHVGLYARVDTSAPIVARQGFTQHGEMTYWVRK